MQNYDEPNNMQCLTQSRLIDMSHLANPFETVFIKILVIALEVVLTK